MSPTESTRYPNRPDESSRSFIESIVSSIQSAQPGEAVQFPADLGSVIYGTVGGVELNWNDVIQALGENDVLVFGAEGSITRGHRGVFFTRTSFLESLVPIDDDEITQAMEGGDEETLRRAALPVFEEARQRYAEVFQAPEGEDRELFAMLEEYTATVRSEIDLKTDEGMARLITIHMKEHFPDFESHIPGLVAALAPIMRQGWPVRTASMPNGIKAVKKYLADQGITGKPDREEIKIAIVDLVDDIMWNASTRTEAAAAADVLRQRLGQRKMW